ncbi:MAG: DUF4923 family protein [Bacteroidia bacterium]|nr:DUF4923 family protein [Bacteroidia bacterium]
MKRIVILLTFCICAVSVNAQSFLSNFFNSSKSDSSSVSSILNKVIEGAAGVADIMPIEGTWTYSSPEIKFKSDDVLSGIGGEVIASKVEGVLDGVYPKLGFDENCKYTFNTDSTFIHQFKLGKSVTKLEGTYSIDKANKNIVFQYKVFGKINIGKVNAYYTNTGKSLSIVYDAEIIIKLVKKLASAASSIAGASSIETIEGLLDKYKGLQLGYKLEK